MKYVVMIINNLTTAVLLYNVYKYIIVVIIEQIIKNNKRRYKENIENQYELNNSKYKIYDIRNQSKNKKALLEFSIPIIFVLFSPFEKFNVILIFVILLYFLLRKYLLPKNLPFFDSKRDYIIFIISFFIVLIYICIYICKLFLIHIKL